MTVRRNLIFASLAIMSGISGSTPTYGLLRSTDSPLANAVILIVRHAEKPEEGDNLTPVGEKRANAYVDYFKNYKVDGQPIKYTHIFAATDSKKSHRPRLTIEPFADSIHMKVDQRFTDKNDQAFADDLKAHDYGGHIIVSWRHGGIPELIKDLGADEKKLIPESKWPDSVFDRVIELHFDASGHVSQSQCKMVKEHLLPGDEI
jgi:hypothetical protein